MMFDDEFNPQERRNAHTGYAWIAAGLIGLGGAAVCIVGIVIHLWGQR